MTKTAEGRCARRRLEANPKGVPAVYEVKGREYILLAVSGGNNYPAGAYVPPGGVTPPAISKSYIAFALPSGEKR